MDKEARKKILRKIPYGLYILGLKDGNQLHGMVGSWLSQCSFEPPLLMLGIKKGSYSHSMMEHNPYFTINFPKKDQKKLVESFFRPYEVKDGKFGEVPFRLTKQGIPVLDDTLGYLECKVRQIVTGGDHDVVVAEIIDLELREDVDNLIMKDTSWHYGG
ncbi:MAG: flavin reductase [Candidatus Omnitrophica bacterium]|nr:flavin reductase [Candidatus Omnitrophota bacterium]